MKLLARSESQPVIEGAGVRLRRAFGFDETAITDPFLLLDDFRGDDPEDYLAGFPWHPHRGIETITYMLEGTVEHQDSIGNKGTIRPGDVQWMTAGSGIIHQEMPQAGPKGRMGGFQLWANLPAIQKMTEPRYRDVKASDIPETIAKSGTRIKIISGEAEGKTGPVGDIFIKPEYLDVFIPRSVEWKKSWKDERTVILYTFEGESSVNGHSAKNHDLLVFRGKGEIHITTEQNPARFLLISGVPLKEPVAWQGPIVMNTEEELRLAFEEYRNGTFLKHQRPAR
jgi:redox-sensitive bicupin YhaK (pirin superfamily)